MISYDFQAGSYYQNYYNNMDFYKEYHKKIAEILSEYVCGGGILEAGIGEATTMVPVIEMIGLDKIEQVYGFDISWSRIKYAEKFIGEHFKDKDKFNLFVGDLKEIPIKDDSMDIVYTIHALEPNGGSEKEILKELYRITSKYLILFEPAYELANDEAKKRMHSHGYITNLYKTAKELGYHVSSYNLLGISLNELNPTGVMIIEKKINESKEKNVLCDPITKKDLLIHNNVAYCEESMLVYPIIGNIPILNRDSAIVATKYMEFYKEGI